MRTSSTIDFGPVGPSLNNGYDVGGARIYPFSKSLAYSPPAMYSNYIGPASGNPITPPVSALVGTSGVIGAGLDPSSQQAVSNPLGKHSPLLWVVGFVVLALVVMHRKGYAK